MPARFFRGLTEILHAGARDRGRPGYHAQNPTSLRAIYDLCVRVDPDVAVDVGTCAGASCLAIAKAFADSGKRVDRIITIGKHQGVWFDGQKRRRALLKENKIDDSKIQIIESDFNALNPAKHIPADSRVFLFHDIHDPRRFDPDQAVGSKTLTRRWIPLIKDGLVAIHDIYSKANRGRHNRSKATHWSGVEYSGYTECAPIIEWINECGGQLTEVPGANLVYFWVKDGKAI